MIKAVLLSQNRELTQDKNGQEVGQKHSEASKWTRKVGEKELSAKDAIQAKAWGGKQQSFMQKRRRKILLERWRARL